MVHDSRTVVRAFLPLNWMTNVSSLVGADLRSFSRIEYMFHRWIVEKIDSFHEIQHRVCKNASDTYMDKQKHWHEYGLVKTEFLNDLCNQMT